MFHRAPAEIMKKIRLSPLQLIIHIGAWFPLARLILESVTGNLTANPIQHIEQRTGRAAISLLFLSLAATPLNSLFGWKEPLQRRRTLGLYSFMYATMHVIIFADLDYGLAWSSISETVLQKPYILVWRSSLPPAHSTGGHILRYLESAPQEKLETPAPDGVLDRSTGRSTLCLGQKGNLLCPAR